MEWVNPYINPELFKVIDWNFQKIKPTDVILKDTTEKLPKIEIPEKTSTSFFVDETWDPDWYYESFHKDD